MNIVDLRKKSLSPMEYKGKQYQYYSLPKLWEELGVNHKTIPKTIKILIENILRNSQSSEHLSSLTSWNGKTSSSEINFWPARILMQDFTGVPAIVDLASMRQSLKNANIEPEKVNPIIQVDLVVDHSVQVDSYGKTDSFQYNLEKENQRNTERYDFLNWGKNNFNNLRVIESGLGICHQVNLEYLAEVVYKKDGMLYPDTLVGTDSHTTMINGLSILGWGVGGIEAEAAMLAQPISIVVPEVIGFYLEGTLQETITATDLVLTITSLLRKKGVTAKFVEFYGPGLKNLSLADRATIANMAPEYGATCGFFPTDEKTIDYLKLTGKSEEDIQLIINYSKAQTIWLDDKDDSEIIFSDTLSLDMSSVEASIAGPSRPQDHILLKNSQKVLHELFSSSQIPESQINEKFPVANKDFTLSHGDLAIAAITSCTNTSNPQVMIAAGLVAKKAHEKGLSSKPWVKTSLAPGSQVVTEYLKESNLIKPLESLGFNLVGYGCTTCIGNSGPLDTDIRETINTNKLLVSAVLSGNRNFEGRIHPHIRAAYLASPPLVVAYAIAGTVNIDLYNDAIGVDKNNQPVYMKDIWPSNEEISQYVAEYVKTSQFQAKYKQLEKTQDSSNSTKQPLYNWKEESSYIRCPDFFDNIMKPADKNISNAHVLAILGNSVTTDHISPAGNIAINTPAAKYLNSCNIEYQNFNSYGSRRGNHEVMVRGTFANIRLRNKMVAPKEGGYTIHIPTGKELPIYEAVEQYKKESKDLVIFAGKDYGTGSSRDWAAKGTLLLGIKAIIAESFERIHRFNLIGMGVLPLILPSSVDDLNLTGKELISITTDLNKIKPGMTIECNISYDDNTQKTIKLNSALLTDYEVSCYLAGGVLHKVLKTIITKNN